VREANTGGAAVVWLTKVDLVLCCSTNYPMHVFRIKHCHAIFTISAGHSAAFFFCMH